MFGLTTKYCFLPLRRVLGIPNHEPAYRQTSNDARPPSEPSTERGGEGGVRGVRSAIGIHEALTHIAQLGPAIGPLDLLPGVQQKALPGPANIGRMGTSKNLAPAALKACMTCISTCSRPAILCCPSVGNFVPISSLRGAWFGRTIAARAIRSRFFEAPLQVSFVPAS